MNIIDQLSSRSHQENPILGAILSVIADGGRIVTCGERSEALFKLSAGKFAFERRSIQEIPGFLDYCEKDLLIVEDVTVDTLMQLNQITGAQIALLSEVASDPSLVDWSFKESDLRSALLQINEPIELLMKMKGEYHLEGSHLNKALFLDRDGVLIEDSGYVNDPSKVVLMSGVCDGLQKAREQGYFLIVVSNQAGIGRGMTSWSQYEQVSRQMQKLFVAEGVFFDRIMRAPFFEGSRFASGLIRRSLRKPRPGMLHAVANEFRIDLSQSLMVGDKAIDLMAGALAGVKEVYLTESPNFQIELDKWRQWPLRARGKTFFSGKSLKKISNLFE